MNITWEAARELVQKAQAVADATKIDRMHLLFGVTSDKVCGDCAHLQSGRYHTATYHKCEVYGMTHGPGTDWKRRWLACGKFEAPA